MVRLVLILLLAGVTMARSEVRGGLLDAPMQTPTQKAKDLPQEAQGSDFDALMKRMESGDQKAWDEYYEFARRAKERKAQQPSLNLPN